MSGRLALTGLTLLLMAGCGEEEFFAECDELEDILSPFSLSASWVTVVENGPLQIQVQYFQSVQVTAVIGYDFPDGVEVTGAHEDAYRAFSDSFRLWLLPEEEVSEISMNWVVRCGSEAIAQEAVLDVSGPPVAGTQVPSQLL